MFKGKNSISEMHVCTIVVFHVSFTWSERNDHSLLMHLFVTLNLLAI